MENPKPASQWNQIRIVRIVVAAIVLALLAAIAIPNFVRARVVVSMHSCVANQMWVEAAKREWATGNRKQPGDVPSDAELLASLRKTPPMWNGSRIGSGSIPVRIPGCTFSPHRLTTGPVGQPVCCQNGCGKGWTEGEFRFHHGIK